jgi:acyl transferase domain-containing protein
VAVASIVTLQQLVRVLQERGALSTPALQDALSEAMAIVELGTSETADDAAVRAIAIKTLERYFGD